jgi:hypothetical protein
VRFALVGALVAVSLVAAATHGGTAQKPAPRLTAARGVVHGTNFAVRQLVRVRFSAPAGTTTRRTTSTSSGAFAARVPYHGPCAGTIHILARDARGDRAQMTLRGKSCGPALGPGA